MAASAPAPRRRSATRSSPAMRDFWRMHARASSRDMARHVRFAAIADRLQERFGTRGEPLSICTACASGATTIQLGLEAIRRGETDAALCIGTDATVHPEGLIRFSLLSALSTANDPAAQGLEALLQEARWLCYRGGRRRARSRILRGARRRAARRSSASCAAAARRPTTITARARSPTARPSSAPSARRWRMRASLPRRSTTSTHTAPARPRMTRWSTCRSRRSWATTSCDTPISSNKSMIGHTLIAAGSVEAVFSLLTIRDGRPASDDQLRRARSGAAPGCRAQRQPRGERARRCCRTPSASAGRTSASSFPESRHDEPSDAHRNAHEDENVR